MLNVRTVEPARDEALLCQAVEGGDISILLMALVALTGDARALDEVEPFIKGPWDTQNIPPELDRSLRARLVAALKDHYARGCPTPERPSVDLLKRMMSVCAGEPVPDEYIPMLLEEMALDAQDLRTVDWRVTVPPETLQRYNVVVIGAGMSGLSAAIKLKAARIPFAVFEKNDAVGGTWYENAYPGCGVDTPNHFYSYSFEPNPDWSQYYSKRDELFAYLDRCADRYGIRENIQFNTRVIAAHYNEPGAVWNVTIQSGDEIPSTIEARFVIFAVGLLNRPSIPTLPGLESFRGPVFHTATWDRTASLAGRRVAMIGCGASGVQAGPSIAGDVERLLIFQRSPHWVVPNANYHRAVSEGKKLALRLIPFYAGWYRFQLFWSTSDGIHASLHVDPHWQMPSLSLNATNERMRQDLIAHIHKQLEGRPDLIEKVIPDYPPYGKRMVRDNYWYQTLRRDNVELITSPIGGIEADAIVTSDGARHPVDAILFATGFKAGEVLAPIDVTGAGGIVLRDLWGADDPRAYLGITVPRFPNMFILYGPGTALAHGGSTIFIAECQVRYVMECLRELIETGRSSMECRQDIHDLYNEEVDREHKGMVWAHKGVRNWYRNKSGRVFANMPWRMVDYWKRTYALNSSDYVWK